MLGCARASQEAHRAAVQRAAGGERGSVRARWCAHKGGADAPLSAAEAACSCRAHLLQESNEVKDMRK